MKKIILTLTLLLIPPIISFADPAIVKIEIKATLIEFEENFGWFEHGDDYEADGIAPLATFKITEPQEYTGKTIKILFKYKRENNEKVAKSNLGDTYKFLIEKGFFSEKHDMIEDIGIDELRNPIFQR